LILEGKLFAPWITDLGTAFEKFRANFQNREPVIGLKNLTAISQEGEYVLLEVDDGGSIPLRRVYQTYLEHLPLSCSHQKRYDPESNIQTNRGL
jgi:hypothetical protein